MSRVFSFLLFVLSVAGMAPGVQAACIDQKLEPGQITGFDADATGLKFGLGDKKLVLDSVSLRDGVWTVTEGEVSSVARFAGTLPAGADFGLFQRANGNDMVVEPLKVTRTADQGLSICASEPPAAEFTANRNPPADGSGNDVDDPAPHATPAHCKRVAANWSETAGKRYSVPILFNGTGLHCYSPPVIRTGDLLVVGMVLEPGEVPPSVVSVEYTNCPLESTTPEVLSNGDLFIPQSARKNTSLKVVFLDARPCGGESPVVSVKIGAGASAVSTPYTLSQYKRYRATFHMGAVYTDLHDPGFSLQDDEGSNVIFNSEPEKRGPEYVAALVVQGIGHYLKFNRSKGDLGNTGFWPYKGRDPIYDSSPLDKLGFVVSAGIEHPGERFGVGLSYEIAYGVNIVGLYEMAKIKQLQGFEIGDIFTGDEADIPTRKEWESKVSIGLTFDLAYATKLFTGAKSGG